MPRASDSADASLQISQRAVARWVEALPSASYSLVIRSQDSGRPVERRRLDEDQLKRALRFLRLRNLQGSDIYGRPGAARHVLVDDLDALGLKAIAADHDLAVVTETSMRNFQAWITVSERDISMSLASAAARILASRYAGDVFAANGRQHGRIPGFTNRKPERCRPDGLPPWVLLRRAKLGVSRGGEELLREARAMLHAEQTGSGAADLEASLNARIRRLVARPAAAEHQAAMRYLLAMLPKGVRLDRSRADFAVARRLLARGQESAFVVEVLLMGERAIGLRPDAARRYAERTVRAARLSLEAVS